MTSFSDSVPEQIKGPLRPLINVASKKFWRHKYWHLLHALPERDLTADTLHGRLTFSSKDSFIGWSLYTAGYYGYSELFDVIDILKSEGKYNPDGYVIDIGANVGTVCIPLMRENGFQRALAFEPEPHNFNYLTRNIEQNQLGDRVSAFQVALSANDGEIEFEICPENHGDHRVRLASPSQQYDSFHETTRSVIKVPMRTLDEMIPSLGIDFKEIALLWMDVQGHEGHVFQGADRLIATGVPIVFEFWPYGLQSAGLDLEWFVDYVSSRFTHLWDLRSASQRMPAAAIGELCEVLRNGASDAQTDLLVF